MNRYKPYTNKAYEPGGFHSHGDTPNWMVFLMETIDPKWKIRGYPHFRKPSYKPMGGDIPYITGGKGPFTTWNAPPSNV